jgi:hypothetical protein
MNAKSFRSFKPGLTLLVLLGACSGDVGNVSVDIDGPNITGFPQQMSESITAHGPITGFGDLSVNNVHYEAIGATVTINGLPGTLADLRRGQIVTVTGRIYIGDDFGAANAIRFDADLVGPVINLDAGNALMNVMGQTVRTDSDTLFSTGIDPTTYAGLDTGDIVQISGFRSAAGDIRATRIDLQAVGAEQHIIGLVDGVDLANLRFTINGLSINYDNAVLIELPGGGPAAGMRVKAIGSMSNGAFQAERLSPAPELAALTGRRAQLAGLVTRYTSPADFEVDGTPVAAGAATSYINGDRADLRLNAEVLIDGDFDAADRIAADRITFGLLVNTVATLTFDLANFTEISVPTVFGITVSQGPEYLVEVSVDTEAAGRVNVSRSGSTLTISLAPGDGNIDVLEAYIVMPALNRIDLDGVVNAHLSGFSQPQMIVDVGGVSRLGGDSLDIQNLIARVSGVSRLDFGAIRPLASADIGVSGVSQATLNMDVGSTLTGSVSSGQGTGISVLYYYGTNVAVDVATDWLSSVIRLGDTRP